MPNPADNGVGVTDAFHMGWSALETKDMTGPTEQRLSVGRPYDSPSPSARRNSEGTHTQSLAELGRPHERSIPSSGTSQTLPRWPGGRMSLPMMRGQAISPPNPLKEQSAPLRSHRHLDSFDDTIFPVPWFASQQSGGFCAKEHFPHPPIRHGASCGNFRDRGVRSVPLDFRSHLYYPQRSLLGNYPHQHDDGIVEGIPVGFDTLASTTDLGAGFQEPQAGSVAYHQPHLAVPHHFHDYQEHEPGSILRSMVASAVASGHDLASPNLGADLCS